MDHLIIKGYVDALPFKDKGSKGLSSAALLWREVDWFVKHGDDGTVANGVEPASRYFPTNSKGAAVSGNGKGGSHLWDLYRDVVWMTVSQRNVTTTVGF